MLWADDAISLKLKLGGAAATTELPVTGCYTEVSATGSIAGFGVIHTITTGGTAISIVGVAAAGNLRKLQGLRVVNVDTAAATVTIYQDSGTARNAIVVTLPVGYQLNVFDNGEWFVRDANGDQHQSGTYAPYDADYLVKTANTGLSAERVVTDTAPITWDWGTAGQAKALIAGATTLYGSFDKLTLAGNNIAGGSTTDLAAGTGVWIYVTGSGSSITSLGTAAAGVIRIVRFAGAHTLVYNATSLTLPTAANITTATGDRALFVSQGSGNWECDFYQRYDGTALVSSGGDLGTVLLQHQTSSGVDAGTCTSGAWRTVPLTNEVYDTGSNCSLSSNQFTLAAGTYEAWAISPYADNTSRIQCRIYNTTGTTALCYGQSAYSSGAIVESKILGDRFTVAASQALELQQQVAVTGTTYGFGVSNSFGNTNIHAQVFLRRIS